MPSPHPPPTVPPTRWDLFCRVVDNLGDVGVCWRLAADLASRGIAVRLVIDDPAPLAWMAPGGAPGVTVQPWPGQGEPGDVVIEAFGCDPPPRTVAAMAEMVRPPVWINLEYLSAEPYVERSHGLPSPQRNGLTKRFFFPGFTPSTGGLLRETGLAASRAAFDRQAWLSAQGLLPRPGERVVTLFCYDNPRLPALLHSLAAAPTLLLLTPGFAQRQVRALPALPPTLRALDLPWLPQPQFDHLLWASDLNFVRGEDSLVRALWAGAPFVWQAYVQDDGAHHAKVDALLAVAGAPAPVAALWRAWNGHPGTPWPGLPQAPAWAGWPAAFRQGLVGQDDLASQLLRFAADHAPA